MNQHTLPAYEKMSPSARKLRDFYAIKPNAPIYLKEFGYYVLDKWIGQGYLKPRDQVDDYNAYLREIFCMDEPAVDNLTGLGWTEAAFDPLFQEEVLQDLGTHELVRDKAGREVLYFKGRRNGFMPEYRAHPVKDRKTWEEQVKWRLDPNTPGRYTAADKQLRSALNNLPKGNIIIQNVIGGYMYLRSLFGPEDLLYMFYDDPGLIHDCMETWFNLADRIIAYHQQSIAIDELFLGEDICYNHGALISPDMMKEFLLPYYQQLFENMKRRNLDPDRTLHFQIDTDGMCYGVIDLYRGIGVDSMSPFEVAAGCNVAEIGEKYPDLRVHGGIDKRILAQDKDAIDRHLESILPALHRRGGYIPTCDHGVPEEVPFENYLYFRQKLAEYGK